MFDHIMDCSKFRPVQQMVFSDLRTGKTKSQKYEEDICQKVRAFKRAILHVHVYY